MLKSFFAALLLTASSTGVRAFAPCSEGFSEISVENVNGIFCVTGSAICASNISQGACPAVQEGLAYGSYCGVVASGVYGCKALDSESVKTFQPWVEPGSTPSPTTAETPAPTFSETPAPTTGGTPAPTTAETPAPTFSETPAPTTAETPAPTSAETPAPTTAGTPAPTFSETPAPTTGGTPAPTTAETPAPTFSETPAPTTAGTPAPTFSETPAPTTGGTPAPTTAETLAPTSAKTPAPTSAETPAPTSAETPAPTSAETPAPTTAETPAPTTAETPAPTSAETPAPTFSETPALITVITAETPVSIAAETPALSTPTPSIKTCDNGGSPVSVEGVEGVFCATGSPVCSGEVSTGVCPATQSGLPFGSYCGKVASGVYGCKVLTDSISTPLPTPTPTTATTSSSSTPSVSSTPVTTTPTSAATTPAPATTTTTPATTPATTTTTTTTISSADCPNGGSPMSIEGVQKIFCVTGIACAADIATGNCPGKQEGLPFGSFCDVVHTGVYGCRPFVDEDQKPNFTITPPRSCAGNPAGNTPVSIVGAMSDFCAQEPICSGTRYGNCPGIQEGLAQESICSLISYSVHGCIFKP